ncbi:hypothetical protein MPTK1_3g18840 [Marchantia polymorpha subsp. ruderalis]|uniref:Uncharacterized protein n=2 Tax=Marchantia polymorpha TaxID=3197 RepID=A0AAF6B2C0_MARPO|nr:hypothetical protein MARPO_0142s0011 [Marchantia polymorpha]BBN06154.1 hypothetical protein Mp_3g18840 [Marchantia polymorpha subsp. ruderalis]|eukprot:PTQ29380.1 hypothetical protein MARPO_0142s0011 [Marchantia polymorpha]
MASQAIRTMIALDPVISASCILSVIGLSLPVVVPPIRNAMSGSEPVKPPKLSEVVEGMRGSGSRS